MRIWHFAMALASALLIGLAAPSSADGPAFDTLDANMDGRLSKAETSQVKDLDFAKADTNKDGLLDRSEYEAATS